MKLLSLGMLAMLASSVTADEHRYLKAFPKAEEGMTRAPNTTFGARFSHRHRARAASPRPRLLRG